MTILGYIVLALVAAVVIGCAYLIVSQWYHDQLFDRFIRRHPGVVSSDSLVKEWTR